MLNPDKYKHIDDNELLRRFYSDKNNEWLGGLLQRYTLLLLGVCMKYLKNEELAKDAVQQVFLKAISELHKYEVDYLKSWLYTIARNHCLMQLRDKTQFIPVTENTELYGDDHLKENLLEKEQTLVLMEQCLLELIGPQKDCLTLFYLQKKSYQEIVELTGFSLLQVKSYIQNGKRNLKIVVERLIKQQ